MRLASSTRRVAAALSLVVAATTVGACSAGTDAVPGGNNDKSNAQASILDRAPVATAEELAASPTAKAIKARGELLVGGSLETPLMSQQNPATGETEGFDASLSKMLAKYIIGQPNTKIVTSTPAIREALIQNGTVDTVIQNYTINEKRAEKVGFAGPYFSAAQAIGILKEKPDIANVNQLNGKKVLAATGSTGAALVQQLAPNAELITFGTDTECVQALEQGRGDAWVKDNTVVAGVTKTNTKVKLATGAAGGDPYGIGIKKDDNAFKKFVNDWLVKIENSGLWQESYKGTLGTVIPGDPPKPPAPGSAPGS